ncbi:hypothetical protein FOL46_006145 [Perkinsus olseni]|nr:hypothetical protein FOL46_006145 [Perkinsus olseni]
MAEEMTQFAIDRDWLQYHTPRNLTLALCGEVGELCELLAEQDGTKECSNDSPEAEEISDCLLYAVRIVSVCGLSLDVDKPSESMPSALSRPLLPHLYDDPNENVEKCCLGRRLLLPMTCSLILCILLYPLLYALKLPYDQSVRALGLNNAVYVDSITEPVGCSPEVRRPLVGVLTLPCGKRCLSGGRGYIAASYVKWLEAAGAQVVPIPHYETHERVSKLLRMVSGVLFTGGGDQGPQWDKLTEWIIKARATEELAGLPVWGTCLGFERLIRIAAGNDSILESTPGADDVSLRLKWIQDENSALERDSGAARASCDLAKGASQVSIQAMHATSVRNMTYNHHDWGVWSDQLLRYPEAEKNLRVLATSRSHAVGKEFVAVVEGRNAFDGVWAVQFHPEKPSFEWSSKLAIDHSRISVEANRFFADFFLSRVREHPPRRGCLTPSEEASVLIYNYPLYFTGWMGSPGVDARKEGYFTETYFI